VITNWPEYDWALQQRGRLPVWVTLEALAAWHLPKTGRRGRSRAYSDLAIETGNLLRLAFGRAWRKTEGLLRSLLDQITGSIASVTADGAYDGEPVYRAVSERQPEPPAAVITPPRATAVPSPTGDANPRSAASIPG
jgi:hypothetical protein